MIRPAAFVGDLVDVGLDCPAATAVVHVAIDVHDVARFLLDVGTPPALAAYRAAPETGPAALILPCRRARHPERDEDVAAEAALLLLERLVAARAISPTQDLAMRLLGLGGQLGHACIPSSDAQEKATP